MGGGYRVACHPGAAAMGRCRVPSERIQRQVDRLLDEADDAVRQLDWHVVLQRARAALALDPESEDARGYLVAAERELGSSMLQTAAGTSPAFSVVMPPSPEPAQPTSFGQGRYDVKRYLGEGGKKRVYLAHDRMLDREV